MTDEKWVDDDEYAQAEDSTYDGPCPGSYWRNCLTCGVLYGPKQSHVCEPNEYTYYNCGSNYCDDPECISNKPDHPSYFPHPEVL